MALTDRNTTPYGQEQHQRQQTEQEVHQEMKDTAAIPTNHSRILMYQKGDLARRILAYDLPIGRADSFDDRVFWKGLIRQADWLEEGSDPDYQKGGDFDAPERPSDSTPKRQRPMRPRKGQSGRCTVRTTRPHRTGCLALGNINVNSGAQHFVHRSICVHYGS